MWCCQHILPCNICSDLSNVGDTEDTCIPLLLIDTAGCDLSELDVASNESKGNEGKYIKDYLREGPISLILCT